MQALTTLLTPLKYLRVSNSHKLAWDLWIPLAAAAVFTALVGLLPVQPALLGERGLVHGVNELLKMLVGFYIASLAAVSSFNNEALDQQVSGEGVTLYIKGEGTQKLTRRRFLSLLFGYLSFLAIVLYLGGVLAQLAAPSLEKLAELRYIDKARLLAIWCYLALVWQLICITMVGLYYLSDRIHRRTPSKLSPEPREASDKKPDTGKD